MGKYSDDVVLFLTGPRCCCVCRRVLLPHGSEARGFRVLRVPRCLRAVRDVHRRDVVADIAVLRRPGGG